jgi:hypothetical protein
MIFALSKFDTLSQQNKKLVEKNASKITLILAKRKWHRLIQAKCCEMSKVSVNREDNKENRQENHTLDLIALTSQSQNETVAPIYRHGRILKEKRKIRPARTQLLFEGTG